jgi:hypothetical protein
MARQAIKHAGAMYPGWDNAQSNRYFRNLDRLIGHDAVVGTRHTVGINAQTFLARTASARTLRRLDAGTAHLIQNRLRLC